MKDKLITKDFIVATVIAIGILIAAMYITPWIIQESIDTGVTIGEKL